MTKQEKITTWLQSHGFTYFSGRYSKLNTETGFTEVVNEHQAEFFYDVMVEAELRGHIDEWLRLDKVVDFNKKRNKAVYRLQLPLEYVQTRTRELRHLKQEGKTNGR